MSKIGFNVPTAAAETGSEWTGETNVYTSNNSYASCVTANTQRLLVTDFDLDLDYDIIVSGIEVSIEGNGTGTGADAQVDVSLTKDGTTIAGTEKTGQQLGVSSVDAVIKIGGVSDLWGAAWDIDEVKASTFGVRIKKTNANGTINIDQVRVRIHTMEGIRGDWDLNFDTKRVTHKSCWLDYDAGSGGSIPVVGDVIYDATSGAIQRVLRLSNSSVLAFGEFTFGEQHDGTIADGDTLDCCSYVDFDTESNGGPVEEMIGLAMTGGTLSGAVVRHLVSDGSVGRIWFTATSGSLSDNNAITIDGAQRCLANGASVDNAWGATADGAQVESVTGYLDYDVETVKFEGESGSERIRSQGFRHNVCILDTTSDATAMLVDDIEDQADSAKGRFYLCDISGTFGNNNPVIALEEVSFDAEQNGGFAIGDNVGDAASPTHSWYVRRLINNGDGSGTLYLERNTGTARFADNGAIYLVSGSQRGTADGAQRQRVGAATIDGTLQSFDVSWMNSHFYTDLLSRVRPLIALDDTDPMKGRVLDQQYEMLNDWLIPHFSTRRIRKGALNQYDTISGSPGDTVYTNFNHLGSLYTPANIYAQQNDEYVEQFWGIGSQAFDILLKNKVKNAKIDLGRLSFFARPFNNEYDYALLSKVGLANPVGINTKNDANNQTAYATVRDDSSKLYHRIIVAWASHRIDFDTGSGTIEAGDVVFNSTRSEAAIVVRPPSDVASGSDLHVGGHGQTLSTWANNDVLDLLDYIDFDAQAYVFDIGDVIDNGAGVTATVRFVQQFGGTRGRIWISGVAGGSWSDNDPIEVGATQYALADGDQVTANTWTGLINIGGLTADNTALLDIGQGGEQPYNAHFIANGATTAYLYEFQKFICEERAGDPNTDPGSLLYPNNTEVQGRFYLKADSAYAATDVVKVAPFGSKAGDLYQGAIGIFVSDFAAGQSYQFIDANGVTRTPPNYQSAVVDNVAVGASLSIYRRFTTSPSGTVDFTAATGVIHIDSGGTFKGLEVGAILTVTGTVNNNGSFTVTEVTDVSNIIVDETLIDESNVSGVTMTSNNVNRQQYDGHATNNVEGDNTFEMTATISTEEPTSGAFIVQHVNGAEIYEDYYTYTGVSGVALTGVSPTLVRTYDTNSRARIALILKFVASDPEQKQIIYSGTPFPVKTKYREEGYDAFTQDATFGATGLTVAVTRQVDNVVE